MYATPLAKCREATEVRHQWLTTLLSRKNPPTSWARFTATTLANYGNSVAKATAQKQDLAAGFAGVTEPGYRSYKELTEKNSTNPNIAVLAMMLAAHESDLSRDSWRRPGQQAAYYLFQLQDWGYVDRTKAVSLGRPTSRWRHDHGGSESVRFRGLKPPWWQGAGDPGCPVLGSIGS
ncbi:hypothetical protein ASH00_06755 [Arthrobacter sp. Soil782]|uniref:hypothetical protein n=1 Tax=Arthrobacter sp. Soil782 TaxID=1736410 RepID=UPI0006F4EAA0|nr:hypothetical protein [Arthrobacter sp. Soil782]KRF09320.1 hypothetical protein ASH00_06755 [Arthrobacter sp. Soil782]